MIPVITELMALPWHAIIASKDWHPKNHCSFAANHVDATPFSRLPFKSPAGTGEVKDEMVWPVHCVQSSRGAEFPEEFASSIDKIDHIVLKGYLTDREYYSAFQDVWGLHHTELDSVLRERDITDVYIVGLALDYCVYNTAVDSMALGFTTHIIRQGTMPVDPNAWDSVTVKLQSKGIEVVNMNDELVERISKCSSRRNSTVGGDSAAASHRPVVPSQSFHPISS